MKTMQTTARLTKSILMLLLFSAMVARAGGGNILGQITDPVSNEPVSFATVVLECQGNQFVFTTNEYGHYYASNLPSGVYTLKVSYQSTVLEFNDIKVRPDDNITYNVSLESTIQLGTVGVVAMRGNKTLFDPADPQKQILDGPELRKMPIVGVEGITEIQSGIIAIDGEFYVRGARAGSLAYYIDGCKVMGSPDIPVRGLDTYRTYVGFIPPKFGDSTGGIIAMETRNFFSE